MVQAPSRVPPLRPGEPPLAILVDFDGTIALGDVTAAVMVESLPAGQRLPWDAGSRLTWPEMMRESALRFPVEPSRLLAVAETVPLDSTFTALAARARAGGVAMEVVSDGFGFFIEPALRRLDSAWVAVASGDTRFGPGTPRVEFPHGNPACPVCGTCKRNRVLAHQSVGRRVVFVGDGDSDRYAAGYADVVFAKDELVEICREGGLDYRSWSTFNDVLGWLVEQLDALATDAAAVPAPMRRPLFCGPEVWGAVRGAAAR
jgi:2-hydroxy-3-keto-5-methylthiopentenyl-1-phosphate phosphatase